MSSELAAIAAMSDFADASAMPAGMATSAISHGEDAKDDKPAVQRSLHSVRVPQREGGDKNGAATSFISA